MPTLDREQQRVFLSGILAEPKLEMLRLVYADWLEERGNLMGEMIRVQIELSRLGPGKQFRAAREASELELRKRKLYHELFPDRPGAYPDLTWSDERPPDWSYGINRGLVHLCIHQLPPDGPLPIPPQKWLNQFGWFVLKVAKRSREHDGFCFSMSGLSELLSSPLMDHCLGLEIASTFLDSNSCEELFDSTRLSGIRLLNLGHSRVGTAGAGLLAKSRSLRDLFVLDLTETQLGDDGLAALSASSAFPELRSLHLWNVGGGRVGFTSLAEGRNFTLLRELHIGHNVFELDSACALANSRAFPNLEVLDLGGAHLGPEVVRNLFDGPLVKNIRELNLEYCSLDDAAARELARSPVIGRLTKLTLAGNPITDVGAEAILRSPFPKDVPIEWLKNNVGAGAIRATAETGRFRTGILNVWNCNLSDQDLEPLTTSSESIHLETVYVGCSRIGDAGAEQLARSPYLKNVRDLSLWGCQLTAKGIRHLLASDALPKLEYFSLDNNPLGDEGVLLVAQWMRQRGFHDFAFPFTGLTNVGVVDLVRSGVLAGARSLRIGCNLVDDAGIRALAQAPDLKDLESLSLSGNPTTSDGAFAIANSPYLSRALRLDYGYEINDLARARLRERFPNSAS